MGNNLSKIAFIGLGRMGITHLSLLNSNNKVAVTSATDPSKVINVFFKKYLPQINLYPDYKELLKKENPDSVVISTPPDFHYEVVKDAVEDGINVFAEKPFTLSYREASELSALAESAGVVNQVGYVNRFNDMFVKAKELIENGVIGDVIRFKSEMFSFTISKEAEESGWRGSKESGGGCLNEMASHALDLVNYLIGVPDKVSGCVLSQVYSKKVDDIVSGTLLYKNGINGTLYVNWSDPAYRKPTNKLEVFGMEGKILVDQHDLKVFLKNEDKEHHLKKGWNTVYITDIFSNVPFYVRGNEFTTQLYHFVECIGDRSVNNLSTFCDAAKTQKILTMIREDVLKNGGISGKD